MIVRIWNLTDTKNIQTSKKIDSATIEVLMQLAQNPDEYSWENNLVGLKSKD